MARHAGRTPALLPLALCALVLPMFALPAAAEDGGGGAGAGRFHSPPTLKELRAAVVRRGVSEELTTIEDVDARNAQDGVNGGAGGTRRLVFAARARGGTQTVVVAVIGGAAGGGESAWVRIQSSALASLPEGHERLALAMSYMLDRNFAMSGAQYARDASDGEVVIRADLPCSGGLAEADFVRALDVVVLTADAERARLAALLELTPRDAPPARPVQAP